MITFYASYNPLLFIHILLNFNVTIRFALWQVYTISRYKNAAEAQ